jgi:uncharacterized membrane protein (UPF0136 family)
MMDQGIFIFYSLFLWSGAFFGWKAGSKISLIAGITSGTAVLLAYLFYRANSHGGLLALLTISALLTGIFFQRLQKTRKFMPGGMLTIISVLIFLYSLVRYLQLS